MKRRSCSTLSIVVPACDAEPFIEPCLRSILAQLEPQHALVVVDDGSGDGTGEIADGLKQEFGHADFTLIRQPNQGVSSARNRALAEARGEYVLFVNADDMLEPGALLSLDAVIAGIRPGVIACDFNAWYPARRRQRFCAVPLGYPPRCLTRDRDAILRTFFADRHLHLWANVFRREIFDRVPQPVFPPARGCHGLAVVPRLLLECDTLYHLSRPIVDYRQPPPLPARAVSAKWCVDLGTALQQVKRCFSARPASDEVHMHIDVNACHCYSRIVRNSYQLPWREGCAVREQARQLFLDSLFHYPLAVLAAMERGAVQSRDRAADAAAAREARKALEGGLAFALARAASRRIWWRQGMTA